MNLRQAVMVIGSLALGVAVFAQGPPGPDAQAGPRVDGRWEIKIDMQMPGMTMPTQTTTQCITPQQAADPQKQIPPSGRGGNPTDCKLSDYKTDGNKVTWSMACEKDRMTGKGEFLYAGDTYTGTMSMNMQGQTMTMKYSGKRLGDCTQ